MTKQMQHVNQFIKDLNSNSLSDYSAAELKACVEALTEQTLKSYDSFADSYIETVRDKDLTLIKEQEMKQFIEHLPKGGKVLVLAAGCGQEIFFFEEHGFKTYAIEPSEGFASHLKEHNLCQGSLTDLSTYADATFDAVFCHAGILHLPDIKGHSIGVTKAFSEASRVLKDGGYMFQQVRAGSGAYIQKETGRFFQLYSEQRLRELGDAAGFKTETVSHIYKAPLPDTFKEWISITYQKEQ